MITPSLLSVIYILLIEVFCYCLAHNLTYTILTYLVPPHEIPRRPRLEQYPPAALVCCVCDDTTGEVLEKLKRQTYPGLDIYVLDDSQTEAMRAIVDTAGLTTVRRPDRKGYKAGNLNNWLFHHGHRYRYVMVADSDCVLGPGFAEALVEYAEHPANSDVILFESVLECRNQNENEFVALQTASHPISFRMRLGIENILQTNLSVGHNNLYRVKPLIELGGFDDKYLSEDHATGVRFLGTKKWRLITVPVVSYERLPANLNEYTKRQARYTVQTYQLTSLKLANIRFPVKMKLLNDLFYFSMPFVFLLANALLISGNALSAVYLNSLLRYDEFIPLVLQTTPLFLYWLVFIIAPLLAQFALAVKLKIHLGKFIKSLFHANFLFIAAAWAALRRTFKYIFTGKLRFNATGFEPPQGFIRIIRAGLPVYLVLVLSFLSVLMNPVFSAFNLVWILPCLATPVAIHFYQRKRK